MDYINSLLYASSKPKTTDADTWYETAQKYYKGSGISKDYSEARKWYEKAAAEGHADAAFKLGQIFFKGLGTEKNINSALEWYGKAADAGHSQALFTLADIFYRGEAVDQDLFRAKELFEKLVVTGSFNKSEAISSLYEINRKLGSRQTTEETRQIISRYEKEAEEQQSTGAMLSLAKIHLDGTETKTDLNEAEYWAREAWERGNSSGAYMMGLIEEKRNNLTSSFNWFLKGTKLRDGDCCFRYGLCFLEGTGVGKNPREALFFLEQAQGLRLRYSKQFEVNQACIRARTEAKK